MNKYFDGRIARLNFFLSNFLVVLVLILTVTAVFSALPTISGFLVVALLYVVAIFFSASLAIRRYHDIGWSGWCFLTGLIPVVNIIFLLILTFKSGELTTNAYGIIPPTSLNIKESIFPSAIQTSVAPSETVPPITIPPSTTI